MLFIKGRCNIHMVYVDLSTFALKKITRKIKKTRYKKEISDKKENCQSFLTINLKFKT